MNDSRLGQRRALEDRERGKRKEERGKRKGLEDREGRMNGRSVKVGIDWMVGGRENEGRKEQMEI